MKKSLLSLALFVALAASAAQPDDRGGTPGLGFGNGGAGGAGGTAVQGQDQAQGQLQGQAQGQVATGGSATAGAAAGAVAGAAAKSASTSGAAASTGAVNASSATTVGGQSVTINEAAIPTSTTTRAEGTTTVKMAPDVYAPTTVTTAVCVIGASGGVSGLGWGVAVGGGIKDEGCEARALASLLHSHGAADAAKELLCAADPRVATAFAKVGKPCKPEVAPQPAAAQPG